MTGGSSAHEPGEIDDIVMSAHPHADAVGEHAVALIHGIEDQARAEMQRTRHGADLTGGSATDTTPPITVNSMCTMVENALGASSLTADPSVKIEATLTTKVVRTNEEELGLKFAVCGVRGGGGVQRTSGNTQEVTVTFDPTRPPSSDADSPATSDADGTELRTELDTLAEMIGLSDLRWTTAAIDLDLTLDDEGKASVIAAGDVKDDSTHHLEIKLTRIAGGEQDAKNERKTPAARA
jgi:hypothetical protein